MLEKMGLPPKPSLRGNNWVVDASHCQMCSSQFTFLNRKHHCRRCGGLFCNTCTQHRMHLRGQGDSPVRICEPCKKLEEAARFELRHGFKSRAGKGSSIMGSRNADEVRNQILGKEVPSQDDTDLLGSAIDDKAAGGDGSEVDSFTPEELRQQALDEKNKHRILKGEGKSAEALKAFKRAKELERQAAALELQLRKNRKKALASSSMSEAQAKEDNSPELGIRDKPIPRKGKEKDDLTAELRELGWSDADIHDSEKKPVATSLEGELFNLIGRDSVKTTQSKASSGLGKSQVVNLKKKALMLKREGKLAEAKEELKKAKILEKQIEEHEFLADADESDDELSALIRSLDDDDKRDLSAGFDLNAGFDLGKLTGFGGDHGLDVNLEVTDDDIHDPEMAAALQSLGWTEEPVQFHDTPQSAFVDREALSVEIRKLKREAVTQKRSGNMTEAMSLLKKAKNLENDLEELNDSSMGSLDTVVSHTSEAGELDAKSTTGIPKTDRRSAPKSRLMVQKELLALKKKALALRREGKLDEADNELQKGRILEQQLEEMDNAAKVHTEMDLVHEVAEPVDMNLDLSSVLAPADDGILTDQDLHDPAYLSVLRSLGWQDEDQQMLSSEVPNQKAEVALESRLDSTSNAPAVKRRRSRAEIQRELLGLKRKALALRRQGQETEADEVLAAAKTLEEELAEIEAPKTVQPAGFPESRVDGEALKEETLPEISEPTVTKSMETPLKNPSDDVSGKQQMVHASTHNADLSPSVSPENQKSPLQQEILAHKRKALIFKREGKLSEAREELKNAKLLERSLQENQNPTSTGAIAMEVTYSTVSSTVREKNSPSTSAETAEKDSPPLAPKPMSSQDRFKLQRECLSHKRNALKLRREGRTEEADEELELAKKLEAQLEEASPQDPTPVLRGGPVADAGVEDLFDPQLLSALQAIGLQDPHAVSHTPVKEQASTSSSSKNDSSSQERVQLETKIKAEKAKALNLKRAGKQAEALEALRRAKQMEKKLNSLPL